MVEPTDRLDSWKEIAEFLKRDVRTVQRWEETESLPVHRLQHQKRSSVYAFKGELEAWLAEHVPEEKVDNHGSHSFRQGLTLGAAVTAAAAVLVAAVGYLTLRSSRTEEPFPSGYTVSNVTAFPGNEDDATFSPGGDQIAFAWDGGAEASSDIWLKQVRLGTRFRLTQTPEREYSPAWAPDGSAIAFLRDLEDGRSSIQLVPPLGGTELRVGEIRTPDRLLGRQLDWEPGKGRLITVNRPIGGASFIQAITPATGQTTQLTAPPTGIPGDFCPAVSEDDQLAFVRFRAEGVSDLFVVPIDLRDGETLEPRQLTNLGSFCANPVWIAPHLILFSSGIWPNLELRTVDVSGRISGVLPFSRQGSFSAAYSAARKRLIFTAATFDINIWRQALASTLQRASDPEPFLVSSSLDWLPDCSSLGDRIIFSSQRSGVEELWIFQRDGEEIGPVTRFFGSHAGEAAWSPNDRQVAFHACIGGSCDIYVKDAKVCMSEGPTCEVEPCCLKRITGGDQEGFSPFWSAEGTWLYFASGRSGEIELWKRRLDSDELVQVTSNGGVYGVEDPARGLLFFSKRDQPGIWKVPLEGGEERQVVENAQERFALAQGTLYYVQLLPNGQDHFQIRGRDLETGRDELLIRMKHRFARSFDVAPDASYLLWAQFDQDSRDLIMVDGFH